VLAAEFYKNEYNKWCEKSGEETVSYKFFPNKLNERGVKCRKRSKGQTIIGWKVRQIEDSLSTSAPLW
jgi:phage/plasmid-associated DNA primase